MLYVYSIIFVEFALVILALVLNDFLFILLGNIDIFALNNTMFLYFLDLRQLLECFLFYQKLKA